MISLRKLSKVFQTTEVETTALCEVDLDVAQGEFVAIMGPSGCGKSTLLSIIGMLDVATDGAYAFDGVDITRWSEDQLTDLRMTALGFVFQNFNLIDELSVFENVELALLYRRGVSPGERRERVQAALTRMGVAHRARHMPQQLSGGQQQRVAIARALVSRPKLILADEPTGNLDTANGEDVMHLLAELNRAGATIIMVTHSHADAAHAQRVVNLLDGAIVPEPLRQAV